jgi:SAM-dependent methyltransferase
MTPDVTVITACRSCGTPSPTAVLALGEHPLANALKDSAEQPEARFPLSLVFCEACGLAQIAETVAKERLFSTYIWVTGTSATARAFAGEFADKAHAIRPLDTGDLVVEVASNDGTFLRPFAARGCRVLGVDPAANIASAANAEGVPTLNAFWDAALAAQLVAEHGRAAFVFARNVIAHASDLHGVLDGIAHMLADDGVGAVEFHSARHILDDLQYDSIYHEHLCYFSVMSFDRLLRAHGLSPMHVESSPISGGALIVYFSRTTQPPSAAYTARLTHEDGAGVARLEVWRAFADRCRRHRAELVALVEAHRAAGRRIIGYGASARSATLLNFCGIDHRHLDMVADRAPLKHGHYTPGSNLLIVPPERAFAGTPDIVLLLAWNFRDEILDQIRSEYGWTGDAIVPLPEPPVLVRVA